MSSRIYQKKALKQIAAGFKKSDRGIVDWATGLGKTRLAISHIAETGYKNTIWFAPSLVLLDQTYLSFKDNFGSPFDFLFVASDDELGHVGDAEHLLQSRLGVFSGEKSIASLARVLKEYEKNKKTLIIFCTYHSSYLLKKAYKQAKASNDISIYDEGHHLAKDKSSLWTDVLSKSFPSKRRLLLSATRIVSKDSKRISMDDTRMFGPTFSRLSTTWGIDHKWLTPFKLVTTAYLEKEAKASSMTSKKITADYVATALAMNQLFESKGRHHPLVFCRDSHRAKLFHALWKRMYPKIPSYYIDGNTPSGERKEIINAFEMSDKSVLINIRVLTEGFDAPICDSVVYLDPKVSPKDIQQSFGRGLRTHPKKKDCIVLFPAGISKDNDTEKQALSSVYRPLINIIRGLAEFDQEFVVHVTGKDSEDKSAVEIKNSKRINILDVFDWNSISVARRVFLKELSKGSREHLTLKRVKNLAKNFSYIGLFRKAHISSYSWAKRNGVLQDVCAHMSSGLPGDMTLHKAKSIARQYSTRNQLYSKSRDVYDWAHRNKHLDVICAHMPKVKGLYNLAIVQELFLKCKGRKEFSKKYSGAYTWLRRNDLLKDAFKNVPKLNGQA